MCADNVIILENETMTNNCSGEQLEFPWKLWLYTNYDCNLRCSYCVVKSGPNVSRRALGLSNVIRLIDEAVSLGFKDVFFTGGEPFIRKDFAEICRQFIQNNGVRQIYVPTNGYFTEKTIKAITDTLQEKSLDLFVVELSLDGMPEFHDTFRVAKEAFKKAMQTYDALAELQAQDPRLRIHAISTATDRNMDEILSSQRKMLERRGEDANKTDDRTMATLFEKHKRSVLNGLATREECRVFEVSYNEMLAVPRPYAEELQRFLDVNLDIEAMIQVVDPALYRNRAI